VSVDIITVNRDSFSIGPFIERWKTNTERPEELVNIRKAASYLLTDRLKMHILQIDGVDYGFVTVSVRHFRRAYPNRFYLEVDLLFVSEQYRGIQLDELDGLRVSEYLMSQVLINSLPAAQFFPFDNIVLFPTDPKLTPLYSNLGYAPLAKTLGWMYLPLRTDTLNNYSMVASS
jgi:hypothetical protein